MKNIDLSILADRLLYGPDGIEPKRRRSEASVDEGKDNSTATSPTIANSSPIEKDEASSVTTSPTVANSSPNDSHNGKSPFSVASTTSPTVARLQTAGPSNNNNAPYSVASATSPIEIQEALPVSPSGNADPGDDSVTSSPTLANTSPTDLKTTYQYSVRETVASSPTSTAGSVTAGEIPARDIQHSSPPTRPSPGPQHPAVKAYKLLLERPSATWHPAAMQIRPLIGILGLCVAIACAFASLTVLVVSDGQATADWYLSPAVLLAIITAVANSAIALAYMEAVPVSFWYSMMRGRTIRSLERQWQVSRSILYVSPITLPRETCSGY